MGLTDVVRNVLYRVRNRYLDRRWRHDFIQNRINVPSHDIYRSLHGRRGFRIGPADWDNLVVLDACRADAFEEIVELDRFDSYRTVWSLGSATVEWTRENFSKEQYGDIVYVTANPYTTVTVNDAFHDIVEIWRTEYDESLQTVPAPAVEQATREIRDEYPNKRIIVHLMQPHIPFIGAESYSFDGWTPPHRGGRDAHSVFHALSAGSYSVDDAWEAYLENVEYVMNTVTSLLSNLNGKTVVTSDHGNLFGERTPPVPIRGYGHITGLINEKLRRVPWAVHEVDGRPQIIDDGARRVDVADTSEAKQRLRELGYHE